MSWKLDFGMKKKEIKVANSFVCKEQHQIGLRDKSGARSENGEWEKEMWE